MHKYHGYLFNGNRIHPNELGWINAQLAEGPAWTDRVTEQSDDVEAHLMAVKPHTRHNRKHSSTILDSLHDKMDLVEKMAEIALRNVLPDHWSLKEQDGADELARDRRVDLMHDLGQAAVEASAA